MRQPLLVLTVLAATATIAAASPPAVYASDDAPQPAPESYAATGAMFGGDLGVDGQLAVEGGHHLDGAWWLHALAAGGLAGDDEGGGVIRQARAGIEARSCTTHRIACAYAGADLGYQSYTWHANEYHMSPDEPHHDLIGVARAGFDLGGRHVRVRPGIETYHALAGNTHGEGPLKLAGLNLTLGVAYQW